VRLWEAANQLATRHHTGNCTNIEHQALHRKTNGRLDSLELEWSGGEIADFNRVREIAEWSGGETRWLELAGGRSSGRVCSSGPALERLLCSYVLFGYRRKLQRILESNFGNLLRDCFVFSFFKTKKKCYLLL
jgi:hypothetical protein